MRLLDLYCGAGGAAAGYAAAGFDIVGVDIIERPRYPHPFVRADALTFDLSGFDAIHASPPCPGYSALRAVHGNTHPLLIPATRARLEAAGVPYVIENVAGAPVRKDVRLCGTMFELPLLMHRYFEISGFTVLEPPHPAHVGRVRGWRHGEYFDGPYIAAYGNGGGKASVAEMRDAKRIYWTADRTELCDALPPAYTQLIGADLMAALRPAEAV